MFHLWIWYVFWYNSYVHPHMDNGPSLTSSPSSGLTYNNQEIYDSRFGTLGAQETSVTFFLCVPVREQFKDSNLHGKKYFPNELKVGSNLCVCFQIRARIQT